MEVQFLHTGEPVLVIEDGEGEPGGYRVGANGAQQWFDNTDYRPAKVVRLGLVEEVEQGQIAGSSYADTSTAQREAAIADGSHPDRMDAQFIHKAAAPTTESTPIGGGSPVSGAGPAGAIEPTALGADTAPGRGTVEQLDSRAHAGADTPVQGALSDSERDELNRLREQSAQRQDPARVTSPAASDTTTG
jgi:hypothetical protein